VTSTHIAALWMRSAGSRLKGSRSGTRARHLLIGREPPPAAALAVAEHIVAAYSASWPADVRRVITPQRLVAKLKAHGDDVLFSPRPALIAYVAGRMGDASTGTAAQVLQAAHTVAAAKRVEELSSTWHSC